jgi:hypothetical protein
VAIFVINEWLSHDSSGENGAEAQRQALVVIQGLANSDHQIVVIEGSPFDQKSMALCKSSDISVVVIVKIYMTTIRVNSDRCVLLKAAKAAELPEDLAGAVKPDDHYLLRAQRSWPEAVLVTTDQPLREAVLRYGMKCLSREEFLARYF